MRFQALGRPDRSVLSQDLSSPGNDKVIFVTHPADGLDDLRLIVLYDFNSFELLSSSNTQLSSQGLRPQTALTMPNEKQKFAI